MELNQIFALPRFFNLFREETSSGYKPTLIVAGAIFAFLLLIGVIMAEDHDFKDFHMVYYPIVLMLGGFYFTSTSFNELNRPEERMNYLSLPASTFEKFSLKLLMTTVGYLILVTLLYWLFAGLLDMIGQKYWNYTFLEFNPFDEYYSLMIKLYLVIQSVFILGAVYFNRYAFFKTAFSVWATGVLFGMVGWLLIRIIFAEYFDGIFSPVDNMEAMPDQNFQDFVEFKLWPWVQNLFWFILAPVMWVVAYFKLKEREV